MVHAMRVFFCAYLKPVIFPRARVRRVLRESRLLFKNPAITGVLFKVLASLKFFRIETSGNAKPHKNSLFQKIVEQNQPSRTENAP